MVPIQENITKINCRTANRKPADIKFLVFHYVGAVSSAYNNTVFFKDLYREASAHYFVDEKSIWQCVLEKDIAWHCGTSGAYMHPSCRNDNSIAIELCVKKDALGKWFFEPQTVQNTLDLTAVLVEKYGIGAEGFLRHYDVTGKICPEPWVRDVPAWESFKQKVKKPVISPNVPAWQIDGFEALIKAKIIQSPDYWQNRLDQPVTAGELFAILAGILAKEK